MTLLQLHLTLEQMGVIIVFSFVNKSQSHSISSNLAISIHIWLSTGTFEIPVLILQNPVCPSVHFKTKLISQIIVTEP